MADLKSKQGNVGTFETVAKWSQGEGKDMASKKGSFVTAHEPGAFIPYLQGLAPGLDDKGQSNTVPTMSADGVVGPLTLGYAWECMLYGLDLKVKARLRPAAGVDSPWISREDNTGVSIKINLATGERINGKTGEKMPSMPIEKCIAAVNAGVSQAVALGSDPQGAILTARRMLLESKTAKEVNGALTLAK